MSTTSKKIRPSHSSQKRFPAIRTAVLPVAGLGTRFFPATKAIPKEMFPLLDKPVIQYLVEEAVASGIKKIVLVVSPHKGTIKQHFSAAPKLEKELMKKGKKQLITTLQKVQHLAEFVFVEQKEPRGDGHAILCAKKAVGNEPFAVLFGDDLVDHVAPALKQLMNVYSTTGSSVVALTKIKKEEAASYGMIKPKTGTRLSQASVHAPKNSRLHEIASFVEKPKPQNAPSNLAIIGKYIVTPGVMKALQSAGASHDGEIRLIDGLIPLQKKEKIYGYEVEGTRYDTGTPLGLITASVDFALKNPTLAPALKAHLRKHI